ncbi:hypothetical protein Skr01_48400 [Sphaerisporangium krabiense]|uniref:Uncharacterized protein n=1 Tax=Sphaerisporangium krabiense TaxID=763782 RepID=A0A7W8Z1X2_9ACTN|nr:hypothetical protein [Sphaerisporangium krabiense]MBB5625953.1 hypothetical protein [Sphaerisporangium krabiense]GII64755.1 hypothetical protein Skr01_48400 [Sphaerisporangium krabiense]
MPRFVRDRDWDGRLERLPCPAGDPPARAAARRALGTLIICATPGSLVVDWPSHRPPENSEHAPEASMLVHLVLPGRPALTRAVLR